MGKLRLKNSFIREKFGFLIPICALVIKKRVIIITTFTARSERTTLRIPCPFKTRKAISPNRPQFSAMLKMEYLFTCWKVLIRFKYIGSKDDTRTIAAVILTIRTLPSKKFFAKRGAKISTKTDTAALVTNTVRSIE